MRYCKGCYYHLYNRGCNRENIFANDENYTFLLFRIKEYLQAYSIRVIAYCLMPNHYHFLVRAEADDTIPSFMQRLFNSYTQAYNKQQNRSGTLFQGKYQSVLVDNDEYLRHLCRYIHNNPVEARLVSEAGEWRYSNYREFIGTRNGALIDQAFVNEFFGSPLSYAEYAKGEMPDGKAHGFDLYRMD